MTQLEVKEWLKEQGWEILDAIVDGVEETNAYKNHTLIVLEEDCMKISTEDFSVRIFYDEAYLYKNGLCCVKTAFRVEGHESNNL